MGNVPLGPDPFASSRRISKAFSSMDAVVRFSRGDLTKTATQQLLEQGALGAGAVLGRKTGPAFGALGSIGVRRTFDLNDPLSSRRISKAFSSMDAVARFSRGDLTKTATQQLLERQGFRGLDVLRGSQRGVLGAGAVLDQSFLQVLSLRGNSAFQDFVEQAKSKSRLLLRRERVEAELIAADPIGARLTVVLGHVGVGRALEIMELMLAEGRDALLALLGRVLLSPESLDVFSRAVDEAPLSAHVELDLRHALEHLAEGDADRAFPSLLTGLEGALRDSARTRGVGKPKNARGAAAVLKMKKGHEHLIGAVYRVANDGRHGEDLDREIGCVLGLVGLVVWMNECLDQPAVQWLGRQLDQNLLAASA
jgi:hypothetical protein